MTPAKTFEKKEAAELRHRLRGLTHEQAESLRRVMRFSASGDGLMAGQWLLAVSMQAPDHPEVLRWQGIRHAGLGEWQAAAACLLRAVDRRPDDFKAWLLLGTAQDHAGDSSKALESLQAARRCALDEPDWLALALEFDRQGHYDDSLSAINCLLDRAPAHTVGLLQRARCFKALGRAADAAADCRALIVADQEAARAWFSLVDLKTVALNDAELAQLERTASRPSTSKDDRQLLDFALGKALEDAGQTAEAFAALQRANQAAQASHPWDAQRFNDEAAAVRSAFTQGTSAATQSQGAEVIFLVGLPRSGTTLIEQVLASHSTVEGASELPYLSQVIDEESRRRGEPFPGWVNSTCGDDWTRLGQRYLQLSARWRANKPISTDKLPENWLLAGAAMAMLPQARIVDCRRDPVETCWSCYKQLFGPGRAGFAYGFGDLAAYWHAYDRLCRFWAARHPERFRVQHYEALVADPEAQIRSLLAFCGLPFEPQCLQFHTAQRAIRTPSALQVRQPLQRTSTPAAGYGDLLADLRRLLQASDA